MRTLEMRVVDWSGYAGFNATFTIDNDTTQQIAAGWTLSWEALGSYGWTVDTVYSPSVSHSFNQSTGRDEFVGSNAIAPGETLTFEFQATMDAIPPDQYSIPDPSSALLDSSSISVTDRLQQSLEMEILTSWGNGFNANFSLTNNGPEVVPAGWVLAWDFNEAYDWYITDVYYGSITLGGNSQPGEQTLTGSFDISVGQTITFEFTAATVGSSVPDPKWFAEVWEPTITTTQVRNVQLIPRDRLAAELGLSILGWWNQTFNATLTLRNTGPIPIPAGWVLTYELPEPYDWSIVEHYDPNLTITTDSQGNDVIEAAFGVEVGSRATFEVQGLLDEVPLVEDDIPDPENATLDDQAIPVVERNMQALEMDVVGWWNGSEFNGTFTITNDASVEVGIGWELTWRTAGPHAWKIKEGHLYHSELTHETDQFGDDVVIGSNIAIPANDTFTFEFQAEMASVPESEHWIPDPENVALNGASVRLQQRNVISAPTVVREPMPTNANPTPKRLGAYYGDWAPGSHQYFPWDIPADKVTHLFYSFAAPAIGFPEYGDATSWEVTPEGASQPSPIYDLMLAEDPNEPVRGVFRSDLHGALEPDGTAARYYQSAWWLPRPTDSDLTTRLSEATAGLWYLDQEGFWNRRFAGQYSDLYGENEPVPPYGADETSTPGAPGGAGGAPNPDDAMGNYRHIIGLRDGVDHWNGSSYTQVQAPVNPDLRVLISIGGWTMSEMFSVICSDSRLRGEFVDSAVDWMQRWRFDGIDIDWEYPGTFRFVDDISGRTEDRLPFHHLFKELRAALDALGNNPRTGEPYELTAAVSANVYELGYMHDGSAEAEAELDAAGLSPWWTYLDAVNLMTYDFFGSWERLTHHNSPLWPDPNFPQQPTVQMTDVMRSYRSIHGVITRCREIGIPDAKLNAGAAFYGRGTWGVADPGIHPPGKQDGGLYEEHLSYGLNYDAAPFEETLARLPPGTYGWTSASAHEKAYYEFWDLDQHYTGSVDPVLETGSPYGANQPHGKTFFQRPFQRYWDEAVCSPWLYSRASGKGWYITYDDPESIGWKADYAWAQNLGGIFFWMLSGDDGGVARTRSKRLEGDHQMLQTLWAHLRLGEIADLRNWLTALPDDYLISTQWRDRSTTSLEFSPQGPQPVWVRNVVNNKAVVRFDTSSYYATTTDALPFGEFAALVVFSGTGTVLGSDDADAFRFRATSTDLEVYLDGAMVISASNPGGVMRAIIRCDGDFDVSLEIDGTIVATGQATSGSTNSSLLLAAHSGGTDRLTGDIAEVMIFDSSIPQGSPEADLLDRYLYARYEYDVSQSYVLHLPGVTGVEGGGTGAPIDTTSAVWATHPPFYADPFGEQGSTGRLQAALDAAASNIQEGSGPREVRLPGGTYLVRNTLTIAADVSLVGDPEDEPVIDLGPYEGAAVQWGSSISGAQDGIVTNVYVKRDGEGATPLEMQAGS